MVRVKRNHYKHCEVNQGLPCSCIPKGLVTGQYVWVRKVNCEGYDPNRWYAARVVMTYRYTAMLEITLPIRNNSYSESFSFIAQYGHISTRPMEATG